VKNIIKKYFGDRELAANKPTKYILLSGETGAGKTTLLNAIPNYLFDVKWSDEFRFQLLSDDNVSGGPTKVKRVGLQRITCTGNLVPKSSTIW
jgi:DNA repair exonuclease SbcCD ATPase subunit